MDKTQGSRPVRMSTKGLGVDASGGPVVDPTFNVLQLVEAATLRQDDLRAADRDLNDARLAHLSEIANIRATHVLEIGKAETDRIDILRNVQLQHVEQMAALREKHGDRLILAEAGRINAIREVDVSGVATAAARQDQQAVVLANQVAASAETLRALVASTNTAVAQSMTQISTQLMERITAVDKAASDRISMLEKTSYEGKGKEAVSDPMLTRLYAEMKTMNEYASTTTGKGAGLNAMWVYVAGAVGLIISILGAFGIVLSMRGR